MWILVTLLVGCSTLALAQDHRCLHCICQVRALKRVAQVESRCSAVGCHMDQGSLSCGMKRYGHRCTNSSSPLTCEQVSRIHNGGPYGCRNANTLHYWNKVSKCYNQKYGML